MSFRRRVFVTLLVGALVPLGVLAFGVRGEMSRRIAEQHEARVAAFGEVARDDLARQGAAVEARLAALARGLAGDNRLRLALAGDDGARRWLLGWAETVMPAAGLAMLRLHDSGGVILSSGHFRNEYDRRAPLLPALLADSSPAVARLRGAEDTLVALAAAAEFTVAGRRFTLVGGVPLDSAAVAALARDPEIGVELNLGGSAARRLAESAARRVGGSEGGAIPGLALPYADELAGRRGQAALLITRDAGPLEELLRRVDLWLAAALGATLVLSLALAAWLAARIAAPLSELAEKTARVDLDRLDERFGSERDDEIGALANLLDAMTIRLRRSTTRLREAERRAATGDLARQVNHDIKNGLAPIRHVLRHLTQVAEREPAALASVYRERRSTLEGSVEYLDNLARDYAKLTPALDRRRCDVNAILRDAAAGAPSPAATVVLELDPASPVIQADPVVLRRITENLVANAAESLENGAGTVTVSSTLFSPPGGGPRVRICVADTGRGMTREMLDRAFTDFYTTKPGGTGLGLSVVRRLVQDIGGTLRVETAPAAGSRFIIEVDAAPSAASLPHEGA